MEKIADISKFEALCTQNNRTVSVHNLFRKKSRRNNALYAFYTALDRLFVQMDLIDKLGYGIRNAIIAIMHPSEEEKKLPQYNIKERLKLMEYKMNHLNDTITKANNLYNKAVSIHKTGKVG